MEKRPRWEEGIVLFSVWFWKNEVKNCLSQNKNSSLSSSERPQGKGSGRQGVEVTLGRAICRGHVLALAFPSHLHVYNWKLWPVKETASQLPTFNFKTPGRGLPPARQTVEGAGSMALLRPTKESPFHPGRPGLFYKLFFILCLLLFSLFYYIITMQKNESVNYTEREKNPQESHLFWGLKK